MDALTAPAQEPAEEQPTEVRARRPARRARRTFVIAVLVVIVWALVAVGATAWAGVLLLSGRDAAGRAEAALGSADLDAALPALREAQTDLGRGGDLLASPLVWPLRAVPVASRNIASLSASARAAGLVAEAGATAGEALGSLDGGLAALAPRDGRLPLDPLAVLAQPVARSHELAAEAAALLDGAPAADSLAAPVADAQVRVADVVGQATHTLDRAAPLVEVLPSFLGADGPRRYFFAAQNPAELRGTGGFIGAYAILTIDDGRLSFSDFGSTPDLPTLEADEIEPPNPDWEERFAIYGGAGRWINLNLTPDFPSAATAILNLHERLFDERLDGVIAADPRALAALLDPADVVDVPGVAAVAQPDLVDFVTNAAYSELTDPLARKELLGTVAAGVVGGFLRGGGGEDPAGVVGRLSEAAADGHLLVHARDDEEQAAFATAGVDGALPDGEGDLLAVVTNAGGGNKIDYYVERDVRYEVELRADGSALSQLEIELHNTAPDEGLDAYLIGPNAGHLRAGDSQSTVHVYTAGGAEAHHFSRDLGDYPLYAQTELGRRVWQTAVIIGSRETARFELDWVAPEVWTGDAEHGRYRLALHHQPTMRPTALTVEVRLPDGVVPAELPEGATFTDGLVRWSGTSEEAPEELIVEWGEAPPTGLRGLLSRPVVRIGG